MSNKSKMQSLIGLAVLISSALSLSACNKEREAPQPTAGIAPVNAPQPAAPPASAPIVNAPPVGTQPPPSIAAPTPAPSGTPAVVAKGDGTDPGLSVEITEFKRTGNNMVTLRMNFINDGTKTQDIGIHRIGLLDYPGNSRYSPVNKGDYHVKCICSESAFYLSSHERKSAWVRFPSPPPSVKKMGIEIPGFQPIDDVPLSD